MLKTKQIFLMCDCSSHTLQLVYDENEQQLEASIWQLGRVNSKMSWKERARWCFHILKTGSPWADGVILNIGEIYKAKNFLDSL